MDNYKDFFREFSNVIRMRPNLYSTSLGLVAATLPFPIKFNLIFVYLYIIFWLVSSSSSQKITNLKKFKYEIIFISIYFILHLFGLLTTTNLEYGLRVIEKNLIFLGLPILILSGMDLSQKQINSLFSFFIIGCGFAAIVNLGHAILRYAETNSYSEFFYYELSQTFGMHPVYLSEYYLFCVVILISWRKYFLQSRMKLIYLVLGIIMCLSIYLLESKTLYAISLLSLTVLVFKQVQIRVKNQFITIGVIMLVLGILASGLYYSSDRIRNIMSLQNLAITKEDRMNDFSKINGLTLRLLFWKYSIEEFSKEKNVLFGVGTGDVQDFLDKTYEKHNLAITIDGNKLGYYDYDIHNQYLDLFYRFGIVGVVFMVVSIVLLTLKFISPLNEIGLFFVISLSIIFVSETFLGLNKGITFFALFYSIFMLTTRRYARQN